MSFDLGVWFPQLRIGNKEAGNLYARLCEGDKACVAPNPAVDAFYAELTAKHPEIDTIPEERVGDFDYCPWSCALDHSPGHVVLSCVWPKATYVAQLVQDLARKHGLAVYDPQSDAVIYPDGSTASTGKTSPIPMWILSSFALISVAIFWYSARIAPTETSKMFYVFGALSLVVAVACFRRALR
jgi:hypothetical protein